MVFPPHEACGVDTFHLCMLTRWRPRGAGGLVLCRGLPLITPGCCGRTGRGEKALGVIRKHHCAAERTQTVLNAYEASM